MTFCEKNPHNIKYTVEKFYGVINVYIVTILHIVKVKFCRPVGGRGRVKIKFKNYGRKQPKFILKTLHVE